MNPPRIDSPRRARAGDIDMIPLINIVLLLLIFFLIAGQPADRQGLRPPTSVSDRPIRYQPLTLSLNTRQQLALNGQDLSFETLGPALQAALSDDTQRVALKVDRDVTAGTLDQLLDVIRSHSIATVMLYSVNAEDRSQP